MNAKSLTISISVLVIAVVVGVLVLRNQNADLETLVEKDVAATDIENEKDLFYIGKQDQIVTDTSTQKGIFTGYYDLTLREDYEGFPRECRVFVVESGTEPLHTYFYDLIERGNTVQELNEDGKLILNLPYDDLSPSEKTLLEASGSDDTVELLVQKQVSEGRGATLCEPLVDVLSIRK